ncbi:MAG: hypothetical protein H0U81_01345 [Pyrinomonadaceae bacterium]|nr:hypothetical protein [Pyrinomonadaceae bacterium]
MTKRRAGSAGVPPANAPHGASFFALTRSGRAEGARAPGLKAPSCHS